MNDEEIYQDIRNIIQYYFNNNLLHQLKIGKGQTILPLRQPYNFQKSWIWYIPNANIVNRMFNIVIHQFPDLEIDISSNDTGLYLYLKLTF